MAKIIKLLEDWHTGELVVGLDEVGRGCGAGPVVTAAVIMPKGFKSELIRDSKKLSEKQKKEAYELIQKNAIDISCNAGSVTDIDSLGIDNTIFKTMHKCIDELKQKPDAILVDGNSWRPYTDKNGVKKNVNLIVKGDDTYTCIAAAAIVAKIRRDEYMVKLHELFPSYCWSDNKGYLTANHISALREHGPTKYHRKLFVKNYVK